MNHFSYDVMRKEKIRDLQREGMMSQKSHHSSASRTALLRGVPKLVLTLLGMLGLLGLFVR